jgi:hypothetical protein
MRPLLAITLSFVLAARLASQGTAEDSVRAAEQARGQALLRADTVALSRLVADEFVEISRLGQVRTRADNIRDIASGDLKLTAVKYDSLVVRIYGEVAVLRGIADNTGTFRGLPFSGRSAIPASSCVATAAGRRWRCSRPHFNRREHGRSATR